MLTRFYIDNFKSLVNFSLPPAVDTTGMPAFSCLVGLNGTGKSTILQAFDFIAHLPSGRIDDWIQQRHWNKNELTSKFSKKLTISFELDIEEGQSKLVWAGSFNINTLRCSTETVKKSGTTVLKVHEGELTYRSDSEMITMPVKDLMYQGSVFSVLKIDPAHSPDLFIVKEFAQGLKSLELLNPQLIKNRAREADDVGMGGEKLTAFLFGLTSDQKAKVFSDLKKFYPNVLSGISGSVRSGWKTLKISENFETASKGLLETETMHLNDGMLRILTIIAQMHTDRKFILLDEIENGINPEIIEKLMDYLVDDGRQIIVTTHSPMVLNYLEDSVARQGIFLIYKCSKGYTRSGRFFNTPETLEKLTVLGPGEVFIDTDLKTVAEYLESIQP